MKALSGYSPEMKVTIREVAKAADVSLGTASRALNGDPTVNPEHVVRVTQAAEKLNYRRLRLRRQPRSADTLEGRSIAMAFLGMDRSLVALPAIAEAVHGVEVALAARGAAMILIDAPDIRKMPLVMQRSKLDGVILKGALQGNLIGRSNSIFMQRLRELPYVWLLGRPEGCDGDCVGANDINVGQLAADHLLSYGHRTVAFVNPKPDHAIFVPRQMGFEQRIRRAGGTVFSAVSEPNQELTFPLHPAQDVQAVQALLDRVLAATPRPTAIYCPADSIAALVYRAAGICGVRIGVDLSVISTNNETQLIRVLHPTLTTIDIHTGLMGERCVDRLAWRMGHRESTETVEIALEPTLISGDSVARI